MRHLHSAERVIGTVGVLSLMAIMSIVPAPGALWAQQPASQAATPQPARSQARASQATASQATASQATASQATASQAAPSPAPASTAAAGSSDAGDGAYTVARPTVIRTAPDAAPVGELRAGAGVEVIGRDRGWVRVRTEAWVPASEIVPGDTAFRARLSAADLRADPEGTRGKMVQWTVQYIALQTADPLRHGLAADEPYLLAKGPGRENAMLYLVVPPSLLGTARALTPLDSIAITARVRDGRSDPVGVPILDLQAIRRLQ